MLIICQRKKRRRERNRQRRWRYLDLIFIPLGFLPSIPTVSPLVVEQELSFFFLASWLFYDVTLKTEQTEECMPYSQSEYRDAFVLHPTRLPTIHVCRMDCVFTAVFTKARYKIATLSRGISCNMIIPLVTCIFSVYTFVSVPRKDKRFAGYSCYIT